jgi:hypothetical protein
MTSHEDDFVITTGRSNVGMPTDVHDMLRLAKARLLEKWTPDSRICMIWAAGDDPKKIFGISPYEPGLAMCAQDWLPEILDSLKADRFISVVEVWASETAVNLDIAPSAAADREEHLIVTARKLGESAGGRFTISNGKLVDWRDGICSCCNKPTVH